MYCCKCGAKLAGGSTICPGCGAPIPTASLSQTGSNLALEQEAVIRDIVSKDRQASSCNKCGSNVPVYTWQFGLGKIISNRRAWGETAVSAAVSAVTVPLLGAGILRLPGRRTSFHVLRLRFMLCDSWARGKDTAYSMHPAWKKATALGYTQFFDANELNRSQTGG